MESMGITDPAHMPKVLILYNKPVGKSRGKESEAGVLHEVQAVSHALDTLSILHRAVGVRRLEELPEILAESSEPVIFNLIEELAGTPESLNQVPTLCEAFSKEASGCDTECMALTLDKWRTKAVLKAAGITVPAGTIVAPGQEFRADSVPAGKYIVKPVSSDASEGIGENCVFESTDPALLKAITTLHERFKMPILVEQFVGDREFNISLLEHRGRIQALPVAEIDFSKFEPNRPKVVDYSAKWVADSFAYKNTPRLIPAPVTAKIAGRLHALALEAWKTLRCRDYARVDMRMDEQGNIFILEVNSNPDISPDAGFAAALQAAGVAYEKFVAFVVDNARLRLAARLAAQDRDPMTITTGNLTIRRTRRKDRSRILAHIKATELFRAHEIHVAKAVLDSALADGPEGDYQSFAAEQEGHTAGWICFGATPCTVNSYDVYWIVVDPREQGKGIGKALMNYAENLIRQRGGHRIIVETSGQALYEKTRGFYRKLGYIEEARLQDFYAQGDDKIIYVKRLLMP